MKKPVAFIIFNRPDTTAVVFEEIRKYQPNQLFVIADGPRAHKEKEKILCEDTRAVVKVDWDCEITTIYSEENLGCRQRIYTGLNEVFEHVEEAIILEDDCLPHGDFFTYCEELLAYYKSEEGIMTISGTNFKEIDSKIENNYYFSKYFICWGWATWRRAWEKVNLDLTEWLEGSLLLENTFDDLIEQRYWKGIAENTMNKVYDSWYYPSLFSFWREKGLSIIPKYNMISNIGFGENSTHTLTNGVLGDRTPTYGFEKPMIHPNKVTYNPLNDIFVRNEFYGIDKIKRNLLITQQKMNFYECYMDCNIDLEYSKVYVYGAGKLGRFIINRIVSSSLMGIIDQNLSKNYEKINNTKVFSIDTVKITKSDLIIISIEGDHDQIIIRNLKEKFFETKIISWKDLI